MAAAPYDFVKNLPPALKKVLKDLLGEVNGLKGRGPGTWKTWIRKSARAGGRMPNTAQSSRYFQFLKGTGVLVRESKTNYCPDPVRIEQMQTAMTTAATLPDRIDNDERLAQMREELGLDTDSDPRDVREETDDISSTEGDREPTLPERIARMSDNELKVLATEIRAAEATASARMQELGEQVEQLLTRIEELEGNQEQHEAIALGAVAELEIVQREIDRRAEEKRRAEAQAELERVKRQREDLERQLAALSLRDMELRSELGQPPQSPSEQGGSPADL